MSDAVTHPIALYLPTTAGVEAMVREGYPRAMAHAAAQIGWHRHCASQVVAQAGRLARRA